MTLFGDLMGKGCDLYHLNQRRLYSEAIVNADFGALVTLAAEVHAAHHYSATLSQRSQVAHQKARDLMAQGKPVRVGWAPAWIDHTPEGWKLNDYSRIIRRLLELIAAGHGYIATANQLNAEGLPAPKGGRWTAGGVTHIAQSVSIAGGRPLKRRTGEVVWDYFPALLERDHWQALLAQIKGRHAEYTMPSGMDSCQYIGQGITTCGVCGRLVGHRTCSQLQRSTGKRTTVRYVRCLGRKDNTCKEPALRLADVVAHILTRLMPSQLELLFEHEGDSRTAALRSEAEQLEAELKAAEAALAATEQEMASLMASGEASTAAVMARAVPAMETKVEELRQAHQAARMAIDDANNSNKLQELGKPLVNLQRAFALGTDTQEQRIAVNAALRRLGIRIVLRSAQRQVGMAVGGRAIQWQPLITADRAALFDGLSGWNEGREGELIVEPQTVSRTIR